MAVTTKIIVQQILNIDDTKATASKFPRYTVTLGNSISSITASELVSSIEAAAKSAAAAKDSEIAAKTSELNAKNSEQEAAISAGASETSAAQSAASATQSAASATKSEESAAAAKVSETNAKTSEDKAKVSETNAKTSETNAKTSEDKAKVSEINAKASETNAAASAIAAKASEDKAKASETNAAASASDSKGYRDGAEIFSAQAAASASAAKTSETNAKTSETNAKTSETNAKTSETNAAHSAASASQSVTTIQGLKSDVEQLKIDTQGIKDAAVAETAALKSDVEQLKTDTQGIKDSAVTETTALKDAAAASAAQASNSATEAGQQAGNAAGSAQSASTDAGRAEVAAGKAEGIIGKSLLKENNLSDLFNVEISRKNIRVDRLEQYPNETVLFSPGREKYITISESSWGVYSTEEGNVGFIPLPISSGGTGANNITDAKKNLEIASFKSTDEQSLIYSPDISKYAIFIKDNGDWGCLTVSDGERHPLAINAGGTGATTPDGVRHILGLATNHIPVFLGVHLDSNNGESSGILYLRNKNAEGVQLSCSRIYNEILGGTAYATIQVTREGGDTNYYQFDESGNAINYNTIAIGRGIINSLGTNSLAIGDSGTGFKQGGNGVLQVFCNGTNVTSFDHQNLHLNGLLNIRPIDDNANGIRVSGSRTGGANALIGGKVSGGAFVDWRDRAAGLLVELPSDGAASNVFKAVRWGYDWVAGLDVARLNTGACEARFNVRGAIYSFNEAGYASCVQWVSASDIRLKANLKEIKSAREKVKSIKGYTYFKRSNLYEDEHSIYSEEAGVIAQDVQTVLPEAVYKVSDSEYLGVSYGGVTALLVNAFNEMSDQVDKQQEEIETLKSEIADLKAAVAALLNKPTTLES